MNKPIINFMRYSIEEYIYKKIDSKDSKREEKSTSPEDNFSIGVTPAMTSDFKHGKITVSIRYDLEPHNIKLSVSGYFELNEDYSEEEVERALVVNGTAIVFPYIRSMISMLSSLDSESAIILPTINTNNLLN
ncbi:hypothetical protein [Enterococcus sp. AZ058]|uniref:hypothetical protein n=1 Tax=Enterococcus sp. AZ058 TaxID=2774838 RepID=UPI003D2A6B36